MDMSRCQSLAILLLAHIFALTNTFLISTPTGDCPNPATNCLDETFNKVFENLGCLGCQTGCKAGYIMTANWKYYTTNKNITEPQWLCIPGTTCPWGHFPDKQGTLDSCPYCGDGCLNCHSFYKCEQCLLGFRLMRSNSTDGTEISHCASTGKLNYFQFQMSFDKSTLWRNILSPDQRWTPREFREGGRCLHAPEKCQVLSRARQEDKLHLGRPAFNPNPNQYFKKKADQLDPIQSSVNDFQNFSSKCKSKFSDAFSDCATETHRLVAPTVQRLAREALCAQRQRLNHLRGTVWMFPKIRKHLNDANVKYTVERTSGNQNDEAYLFVSLAEPKVSEPEIIEKSLEIAAVSEAEEVIEEQETTEQEPEMKEQPSPSEVGWYKQPKSSRCWIDDATISSFSDVSDVRKTGLLYERKEKARDASQAMQASPNETVTSDYGPYPGPVTPTMEDSQRSDQPAETPVEQTARADDNVPDEDLDGSRETSEVDERQTNAPDVGPPPYICPSSPTRSHMIEIKRWLSRSTFSAASRTMPMM